MAALEIGTMAAASAKLAPTASAILQDSAAVSDELAESKSKIKQGNAMLKQYENFDDAILEPLIQAIERLARCYKQAEEAQKSYEETDVWTPLTFKGITGIISHFTGSYTQNLDELQKAVNAEMIALRAFHDAPVTAEPLPTLLSNTQSVVKMKGGFKTEANQGFERSLSKPTGQKHKDNRSQPRQGQPVPTDQPEKEHRICSLWD